MDSLLGIHHVAVTVSDRDASASWYQSVLGLEELFREEGDTRRACVMRFPGAGYAVGVVEHLGRDSGPFEPQRTGLDHLAFTVGSRSDLDAWADRLADLGVVHSGVTDIPSGAILNFRDPDDISLALFWDGP